MKTEKVEKNRMLCDPFYHLLFYPNEIVDDKKTRFIDLCVKKATEMTYKKYYKSSAPDASARQMKEQYEIMTTRDFDNDDTEAKLFFLFGVFAREPTYVAGFVDCYDLEGGYFEERGPLQFQKTVKYIRVYMTNIMNSPYNITNVVNIVRNFINEVKCRYMTE